VVPLTHGVTYTVKLQWKTNKNASGATIYAGAGPIGGKFSPSSLLIQLFPAGTNPAKAISSSQYHLTSSDGTTWQNIDATNLSVSLTPATTCLATVSGNADLWTANAGYNQDLGVTVSGGAYPSASGKPEAWKESGGFAGTFSPNAAYVQTVIPVLASTAYTAKLQWKSNKADPGTIFAAAGLGPAFSPTRLTVRLIPKSAAAVFTKFSTTQYHLTGNNGATWADMDSAALSFNFTVPASGYSWAVISGNADLWTANAGYNQDIGINLSGGTYPASADPLMWKESGGNAGTFSPNAAYAQAGFTVAAGTTYTTKLQWKANKSDPGTIYAAAGLGPVFSPTTLSVILLPTTGLDAITSTDQFIQDNSDGSYWQPLAPSFSRTASSGGSWLVTVNSDLWTSVPAYNQDIGIIVSGGAYGSGTLVAWKESGGRAGTFSPNAAFLSTVLQLQPATSYTVVAVWKANREAQESNAIWAGAGPINTRFSPTILSMEQVG
jgi:hypothetical protein